MKENRQRVGRGKNGEGSGVVQGVVGRHGRVENSRRSVISSVRSPSLEGEYEPRFSPLNRHAQRVIRAWA